MQALASAQAWQVVRPTSRRSQCAAAANAPLRHDFAPARRLTAPVARRPSGPAAAPGDKEAVPAAAPATEAEEVFLEGSGSNVELALSLLLAPTLLYLPLTLASVGRRLWIKYKFTNKRVIVTTNSPVLKREVQVAYDQVKEVRTAPRAFGAWGDMVIFLKDGSRLELVGVERAAELKAFIQSHIR